MNVIYMDLGVTKAYHLIICCLVSLSMTAQNTDSIQMVRFAKFLDDSKLYEYAAEEYERLYFLYPNETTFFHQMLKSYRSSGNIKTIDDRFENRSIKSDTAATIYILSQIDNKNYDKANQILELYKPKLPLKISTRLDLDITYLQGNYLLAKDKYNSILNNNIEINESYLSNINEGINLPRKSPLLAGILSGIVPGSGRAYTKDYKDAIVSFIFVASSGYQAYRRFRERGIKSPTGWIYGGITLGFYVGNIYGAVKSAKLFNQKQKDEHTARSKKAIDIYYSNY